MHFVPLPLFFRALTAIVFGGKSMQACAGNLAGVYRGLASGMGHCTVQPSGPDGIALLVTQPNRPLAQKSPRASLRGG